MTNTLIENKTKQKNQKPLLREDNKGVTFLTLNRPEKHNSLNLELLKCLQQELQKIAESKSIRVVIIASTGTSFCAGHDLIELKNMSKHKELKSLFLLCSSIMESITELPQPVIAQVQGMATAAGCQLVATCDLAIASDNTNFCTPGVNIGLFCSTPMVALSRNITNKRAMEMLLTGENINALTALEWGLINRVVPPDELKNQTSLLANKIAQKPYKTIKIGKKAFYNQLNMDLHKAYIYTSQIMAENMLSDDAEEGINAFTENREPSWPQS
ncbi:MAG: enoyl-CoA hydratase [Rhodospirillaceae bacterium]|nr:enoyl-CoA hydratase [Rhodospirillaceae bacterium]|tara:strand:+ start:15798 stop:16613 length:816 start_codon:yes stop_codon:yes gene_type:complete